MYGISHGVICDHILIAGNTKNKQHLKMYVFSCLGYFQENLISYYIGEVLVLRIQCSHY